MKRIIYSLCAVLLLISCNCQQEKDYSALEKSFAEIISTDSIPAISVAYFAPNDTFFTAEIFNPYFYSQTEIDSLKMHAGESVFQAASLSKVVFAYIVNKMAQRGEIDLDTPIEKYTDLNRFVKKGGDYGRFTEAQSLEMAKKLTPRIVLSHRTGLPNWSASVSSDAWPTSHITFKFAADSCYGYSGEGFALLQRAVEAIKGKDIQAIATEEVFGPLGMKNTSYAWEEKYDTLTVNGYNRKLENRGKGRHPRANVGYTLRTTANDYIKFVKALMDGINAKDSAVLAMVNIAPDAPKAIRYAKEHRECDSTMYWGLGVGLEQNPQFGKTIWHWGNNGNFRALFILLPEHNKGFVYFTNGARGHDIVNKVTTKLLGGTFAIEPWINS